jgi:SAM-dependent methyltransferase
VIRKGYEFNMLEGVSLPFDDDTFDLVISNHVIEHVGGKPEQMTHLSEISRVLRSSGIGYLALPNRWALREPHFRLWLLSWLPRSLCDIYVRYAKKGSRYDCWPRGPIEIRRMIRQAGLTYRDRSGAAARIVGEIEPASPAQRIAAGLPNTVLRFLSPLFPTTVFLLWPQTRY